jgi:hypothetical protein
MGYCYEGRKLCCDVCGVAGGVRKRKCSYGYCKPPAVCGECWKTYRVKFRAGCDDHCRTGKARFEAEKAAERALLDEGHYTRRSAVGDHDAPEGWTEAVKVWFRNKDGAEQVYRMEHETYRAVKLMQPATPFDFAKHGKVVPA